ncbi:hypothetical protein IMZ48_33050 [Candidatus Bathyarchaeota archaeon]|nr:hypothetical protein [Candidatus Bathyarchaeota archaeon]
MPPKAKGRRQKETAKPLSGLDIDALLAPPTSSPTVSPTNAIPEYNRALSTATDMPTIEAATKKMGAIIREIITSSFGGSGDDRALEHMGTMRGALLDFEEPALYNDFARDLKGRLLSGELGGDRREVWWKVRRARLGLIDWKESDVSKVTEDEAKEVGFSAPDGPLRGFTVTDLLTSSFSFTLPSSVSHELRKRSSSISKSLSIDRSHYRKTIVNSKCPPSRMLLDLSYRTMGRLSSSVSLP